MLPLAHVDPEIHAAIAAELHREQQDLELIASENYVSVAVLQALGTLEIVVRIERRQGGEWAIVSGPDATPYSASEANERHTGQSSSGVNAGSAERRQAAAAYTADVPPDRWPGSTRVPSPIPVTDKE